MTEEEEKETIHPGTTKYPGEGGELTEKETRHPTTRHIGTIIYPGEEMWTTEEEEKETRHPGTTKYPGEEMWTPKEEGEWIEKETRLPTTRHTRTTKYPGEEVWTKEEEGWTEKETGQPGRTEYPGEEVWTPKEEGERSVKQTKHQSSTHPGTIRYSGEEVWTSAVTHKYTEGKKGWTEKETVRPATGRPEVTGKGSSERTQHPSGDVWKTSPLTQGEWTTGYTVTSTSGEMAVTKYEMPKTSYNGSSPARVTVSSGTTPRERVETTIRTREEATSSESGGEEGYGFAKHFQPTASSKVMPSSSRATPWTAEQPGTTFTPAEFSSTRATASGKTDLPKEPTPQPAASVSYGVKTNVETYNDIYSLLYLLYYPFRNYGAISYLPYSEELVRWWKDYYYYHLNNPSSNVDYITYVWRHIWKQNPEEIETSSSSPSYNNTSIQFTTSNVRMSTSSSYRPRTTEEPQTDSSSTEISEITATPGEIAYVGTESTAQQTVSVPYGVSTSVKTHDYIYNLMYLLYYPLRNNSTVSYLPYSDQLIRWWNNYYYHTPSNSIDYLTYVWMNMWNQNPDQIQPSSISAHYGNTSRWSTQREIGQIMCYYPYKETNGTLYHSCEEPSGGLEEEEGKSSQPLGYSEYIPPYYPAKNGSRVSYSDYWTYKTRKPSHSGEALYTYSPFSSGSRITSYTPQLGRGYGIDQYDQGGRNYSIGYFPTSSRQGYTESYFIYYPISDSNVTTYATYETTSSRRYTQWNHTFYTQPGSSRNETASKYTEQVYNGSQVVRGKNGYYIYAYSTGETYSEHGTYPLYYIYYPLQKLPQVHFYPFVKVTPRESPYTGPSRHYVTIPHSISGERKLHTPSSDVKHAPKWVQGLPWMRLHYSYVPYSTNPYVCYIKLVPYAEKRHGVSSSSSYGFSWSTQSEAMPSSYSYQSVSTNRTVPSSTSTSYYGTYVSPSTNQTYGSGTETQPPGHYSFSVILQNGTHGKPPAPPSGTQYRSSHITYRYGYSPSSTDNGTYFRTHEISNGTRHHHNGNSQSYGMALQNGTYWRSTVYPNGTRYISTHISYSYGRPSSVFQNRTYVRSYQIPSKIGYYVGSNQPNGTYYNTSRMTYHYGQPSFNPQNRTHFHSFGTTNGNLHYMNTNHSSGGSLSFYNGTRWTTQTFHNTTYWQSHHTFYPSQNFTHRQSYVVSPQIVQQGGFNHQTRVVYPSQNSNRRVYSTVYRYGPTNVGMVPVKSGGRPSGVYYGRSSNRNSHEQVYSTVLQKEPINVDTVSANSGPSGYAVSQIAYNSGDNVPHNRVRRTRSERSAPVEDTGIIEVENGDSDNDTAIVYNSSKEERNYIPLNETSSFELSSMSEKDNSSLNTEDILLERNATEKDLSLVSDLSNETDFTNGSSVNENNGTFLLDNVDTVSIKDDTVPIDYNGTYPTAFSRDENETILTNGMDEESHYEDPSGENVTSKASNETSNSARENEMQTEVKDSKETNVFDDQSIPIVVNEDESMSREGSDGKRPIKFSLSVSMSLDTPDAV